MRCRSLISMLFGVAVLPLFSFAANSAPTITPVIPQQDAADNCYMIGSAAELYGFAKMVNEGDGNYVCAKLTEDIKVNDNVLKDGALNGDGSSFTPWTPIGWCSDGETHDEILFRGKFHGQGHTISGLYFNDSTKSCIGLIGAAAGLTVVDSVGLLDSYFNGNGDVGGLVGAAEKLTITNSYNMGTMGGYEKVGGLVGNPWLSLTITNSYNTGSVSGYWYIGGLAGSGEEPVVSGSYNMGAVSGEESVGGLVGGVEGDGNDNDLEVINSYNVGVVTGLNGEAEKCFNVGGLVGRVEAVGTTVVRGSYNTGTVTVSSRNECKNIGGLVGKNDGLLIIRSSYNEGYVGDRNVNYVGGLVGYANDSLNVFNSYNAGVLEGNTTMIGYFAGGGVVEKATIANSYNMGCVIWNDSCRLLSLYYKDIEYVNVAIALESDVPSVQGPWEGRYEVGLSSPSYVSIEDFADGTVAKVLRDFCDKKTKSLCESNESSIWGQVIGRDNHPTLSGVIGYPLVLHTFDDNVIDSVYNDEKSDLLTPKRKGYTFTGWFANEACANGTSKEACIAVTKIPSGTTGEQHFYARWSMNPPLADGCYEIASADQLYAYATLVNAGETTACGRLADDIKVNDHVLKDGVLNDDGSNFIPWTPIGTSGKPFRGEFHGQGYTISGLYFNGNESYVGLFGNVQGSNVIIDSVGLLDSYFNGGNYVGGIVGGVSKSLTISDSYNAGFVSGDNYVGGLVGNQSLGTIVASPLTITNSYNAGAVSYNTSFTLGTEYVGGLVGAPMSELTIRNSYNAGPVNEGKGNAVLGSRLSTLSSPTIDNVFYLEGSGKVYTGAKSKSGTEFADGSVALLLRGYKESGCTENCISGSVWGQNVGVDAIPNLDGKILNLLVLDAKGGSIAKSAEIEYADYEAETILPTASDVTREHYVFQGWFVDEACADGTSEKECSAVTTIPKETLGKQTFFAKWIVEKYSVKWTVEGKVVQEDELEYLAAPEYKGKTPVKDTVGNLAYQFTDWTCDIKGWEKSMGVTSDMTFTAQFKESVVPKSSSSAKSSSSKAKSGKSSSSKKKDALEIAAVIPQFSVNVVGRSLQVAGAKVGTSLIVFDMQGKVVLSSNVNAANFAVDLPHAGGYLVRVGLQTSRVNVR